jgi:hypothetical protein
VKGWKMAVSPKIPDYERAIVKGLATKEFGDQDRIGVAGSSYTKPAIYALGDSDVGLYATSNTQAGVYGTSVHQAGVYGTSVNGSGVLGKTEKPALKP